MKGENEENIVRLAKKKDTASLRKLYDSHVQYLTAVCSRYIGEKDGVKDVLQESFIKIFSAIDRFEWKGEGALRAWMKRIVINESLMYLRSKVRNGQISFVEEPPDTIEEEDPQIDDIPMSVLQKIIRGLPTGYRTVFNLYAFEGKTHKEIASALGISENTSYSQFSRAKSILAKQIKEYLRNEQ